MRSLLSPFPGVNFHAGFFPVSASEVADRRFCFVHLDLDLRQATADALEFFYPRMVTGGVLIGDDYNLKAVHEAFAGYFAGRRDAVTVLPWDQVVVAKV